MITISINGKTYKDRNYEGDYFFIHQIYQWIEKGFLEEVKENKEPTDKDDVEAKTVCGTDINVPTKDTSILEKLRADIEKRIEEYSEWEKSGKDHPEGTDYAKGAYYAYKNIEMLLTSLETPQFTPGQEDFSELPKINDTNLLEDVCVWTPKPGQEEQVTIPEFDYDKIHMEAMKDHVGSFATHVAHPLCKQMSEITQFLHSKFPNSKK